MGEDFSEDPVHDLDLVASNWVAVGAEVRQRIEEIGLTLTEFEERSGVSDATVRKVMRGEAIKRADKKRQLCDGLGWTRDSIDRILRGEAPLLKSDAVGAEADLAELRREIAAHRQKIEDLTEAVRELGSELRALQ